MPKAKDKTIDPEVIEVDASWPTRHDKVGELTEGGKELAMAQAGQGPAITPMSLIEKALSQDASIETLERLYDLQVKYEENEAKKAFNKAFAAFKSEAITIIKDKKVGYSHKDGGGSTAYDHASIGNVIETITPPLSKHDLALSWDVHQDGNTVQVTATLMHALGHSKSVTMSAGADNSGKKNSIQAVASTKTYLERYTALAVTGLATKDQEDDDGRGSEGEEPIEVINEEQLANLEALFDELKLPHGPFLTYFKISSLEMLPAENYNLACEKLEKQRSKS